MNFKMLAVFFLAAAMFIISPFQLTNVFAQKDKDKSKTKVTTQTKQVVELKSNRGTATGDDPNITTAEMPNNMNAKTTPPTSKGGNSKGATGCKVIFDNRTGWHVKLYVNGRYRGTVGEYDDAYLYVTPSSNTVVYARVDFDDGSWLYWGPTSYDCGHNQYINFKINP